MPSKKPVEPLDGFERDVPTTHADNLALWRVRELNPMGPYEYLQFLLTFTADEPASREITPWAEPFEL
ncbi:MAG: hypothetical protein JOZ54_13795 [Acidobacteria bacterium]|nr:hypothetical protein [Acidobacteriota bacterium]